MPEQKQADVEVPSLIFGNLSQTVPNTLEIPRSLQVSATTQPSHSENKPDEPEKDPSPPSQLEKKKSLTDLLI